ncbi:hypothetical protein [Flavihumibacter fluvii]|uniref:hypothetical protein n=1 Tax=Flavihumibacter fluvii TaxID=2838157 RepID=UPI001BDF27ED|nr:hypothetical protein [Flavihumibacter fluvii]ULQ52947.1 hypothetical protein KJS93_01285 [Flavihumibacter fluvii]
MSIDIQVYMIDHFLDHANRRMINRSDFTTNVNHMQHNGDGIWLSGKRWFQPNAVLQGLASLHQCFI